MIDSRSLEIIGFCKKFIGQKEEVLDIGSGTGWVAKHLQDLLDVDVTCVDVVNEHQTGVPFFQYDGKKLPFDDGEYDTALLIYTLHHCSDPLSVLKEAKRVSKSKIIIFEDTYNNCIQKLLAKLFDYYLNKKYNPGVKLPFNFKKEEEWITIFRELNMEIVQRKYVSGNWRYPVNHIAFILKK